MATPRERLQAIVNNVKPTKVVFQASLTSNGRCYLTPTAVSTLKVLSSDDPLQNLLLSGMSETWDLMAGCFKVTGDVDELFSKMKKDIITEYACVSNRCSATKRKTEMFVQRIDINDRILSNYLISTYIEINSSAWAEKKQEDRRLHLEMLESLRRMYGNK